MITVYIITLIMLVLFNFIASMYKIKNKTTLWILDYISIIILVLIMAHSNYSDLMAYERHYSFSKANMLSSRFEYGFNLYMVICKFIFNLSFYQFKLLTFTVCILLIYISYKKFTYNFSYFIMMFMLYEIFFDGVQMRNFIAISLIIFGLPYLFTRTVKGTIVYIVTVFSAFFFHSSSVAFIVFLVVLIDFKKLLNNRMVRFILAGLVVASVFIVIHMARTDQLTRLLSNFSSRFISLDVSDRILSHSTATLGTSQIYLTGLMFLYCFWTMYLVKRNENTKIVNEYNTLNIKKFTIMKEKFIIDKAILKYFVYINLFSLFFTAMCFLSTTFYRLLRDTCLIDVFLWGILINNSKKRKGIIIYIVGIVLVICWVYYDLIVPDRFLEHIGGFLE
ncbi:MAG: EpsG family protein [Bacteroides sp.]|nr:EpsG family protein [Bacteroides sp.]